MDTKPIYLSKTFYAAVILGVLGIIHYAKTGDVVKCMELLAMAFGMMGIRMGDKSIGS